MKEQTDLTQLYNPYDFANPVSKVALFSGRKRELEEIDYYLDEATKAPRPMNLAILGARASGKTSLLNMIDIKARERKFCVARVDLNEGDVQSQLGFFHKFFDSVFSAVCDYQRTAPADGNPFGGKNGKTYDAYLDMVTAYQVPPERDWCPFLFPIQYAKAMAAGVSDARVSDNSFRHDLDTLRAEVGVPIAVLIDECNVLAQQRVLLEILRNLFMNTPGYMLVFTGTPDLFPVMDEVFSPIVRQFKKISVGPFEERKEVEGCIRKPLETVGLALHDMVDPETLIDLTRRQPVTGGRPYEIQLLCHFMFRRMQLGRASRMELDIDVLDDVLAELQQAQDIAQRRVVRAVRCLTSRQLEALQTLGWSSGPLRFEELWFVEYVPFGTASWTRDGLAAQLQSFSDLGILAVRDECVVFAGDELERLYCKYYARRNGSIPLDLARGQPEAECAFALSENLQEVGLSMAGFPQNLARPSTTENLELASLLNCVAHPDTLGEAEIRDPRFFAAYCALLDAMDHSRDSMDLVEIRVRTPWMITALLLVASPEEVLKRAEAETRLREMSARAAELGGLLIATWGSMAVTPVDALAKRIAAQGSARTRARFADEHHSRMFEAYSERGDREAAALHAACVLAFGRDATPQGRNNAAYVLLQSDPAAAETALLSAIDDHATEADRGLPHYNLGVIMAQRGDLGAAADHFEKAGSLSGLREDLERNVCAFLVVPHLDSGRLRFEEIRDIDLRTTAADAAQAVRSLLRQA